VHSTRLYDNSFSASRPSNSFSEIFESLPIPDSCRWRCRRFARRSYGDKHPELGKIHKYFAKMGSELLLHLVKEEQTLFPMITKMEEAAARHAAPPRLPFGTIQNPIGMMVFEHDEAETDLAQIRKISIEFTVPPDADASYHALYEGLKGFEQDMHEHVFLENFVLFPRASAIEKPAVKEPLAL